MNNFLQKAPYLRQQRKFPNDNMEELSSQVDQAYIDIANKVNDRTIGIFSDDYLAITGEKWFLDGSSKAQQTIRQVYPFTAPTLTFAHGINFNSLQGFTRIYGTFTDGTNWYPLPYVNIAGAVASQVKVDVTPTQIIIAGGGGGSQPVIQSGYCILEWLSQF